MLRQINWQKIGGKKFSKQLVFWGGLIVIIVGIYSINKKETELLENGIETEAIILSFEWGTKGIKVVEFQFKVKEVLYTGYGEVEYLPCALNERGDKDCLGTEIKIIYSSKDPKINKLIAE